MTSSGKISVIVFYVMTAFLLLLNVCSPFVETQVKKQEVDSLYIFDEIPPEDSFKFEAPVRESVDVFVVQIGAFSNLESAKDFAEQSRVTLKKDIKVEFNEKKNLYVIWIHPPFQERVAAETFRSELWNYEEFKDAWIVTIESRK